MAFNPGNASYHPVAAPAKSSQSRTLVASWSGTQQMLCTDCHNNDQGPGAKGAGPNGPHGSQYAPLLERYLNQADYQAENANAYALCYKCHSQGVLMGDRLHSRHVRDNQTACSTCHDAHGGMEMSKVPFDAIVWLLGDVPNLILLDEVLEYIISAGGINIGDTTLRDETISFVKRLTTAVGSCPKSAMNRLR